MKDIEKKEKVYELQKCSLIGPQLTNILLMLVLFLTSLFKEFYLLDYMLFLILLIILSNCFTGFYFLGQLNKYDTEKYDNKTIEKIEIIVTILIFVFLTMVTIKNIFFK